MFPTDVLDDRDGPFRNKKIILCAQVHLACPHRIVEKRYRNLGKPAMITMKKKAQQIARGRHYDGILSSVSELLEQARRTSAQTINAIHTATYWEIKRQSQTQE